MSYGKCCSRCRRDFHPSAFYRNHSWCRWCFRVYTKGYRRRVRLVAAICIALAA